MNSRIAFESRHPLLVRTPAALLATAIACLTAATLLGQPTRLQFEVASIRPTPFPNDAYAAGVRAAVATNPCSGGTLSVSGTRVSLTLAGICDIVRIAYDVKSYQVTGVPATLGFSGQDKIAPVPPAGAIAEIAKQPTFFYDIEARAPGSDPPNEQEVREMLRALLTDRFRLTLHRDKKDLSYYALVAANNGPKLTPAAEGCKPQWNPDGMTGCSQTIEQLTKFLNSRSDRTVVDMTGLSGKFDYEIPIDRSQLSDFGAVAAAVQGHLKLKLEPRKGPIEVLVIDHVERPSEN